MPRMYDDEEDEDGDSAIFKLKVNIDLGVMATLKKKFFF